MSTQTVPQIKPELLERQDLTPTNVDDLNVLFGQLSESGDSTDFSSEQLAALVSNTQQNTYVVRIGRVIAGMATALTFYTPKGIRIRIDYVATNPYFRRMGVASALLGEIERLARLRGCRRLELNSNPSRRPEANVMYKALGYRLYETNVFHKDLV